MANNNGDDNFFSRWSRRKVQVRTGEPLPVEPVPPVAAVLAPAAVAAPAPVVSADLARPEAPPTLTLDDVASLTRDSDFSAFLARGVPSDVRNAAVKKLFTDPHYNVMDGLDIYIDDYSKPSPLSAADMAKMVGAQFLKLVDDPNEKKPQAAHAAAPEETDAPQADASKQVAQAEPEEPQDDHADLQLQPDHAPGPQGPGPGAG